MICIYIHYIIEHFDMNIWVNIFFEIRILKSYLFWPHKIAISMVESSLSYDKWFSMPSF
jgi:hypothetical protein